MSGILNTPEAKAKAAATRAANKEKMEGVPTLRQSVNMKCRDCICDEKNGGTWRQQVEACTCTDCPLYPHRPRSASAKTA